jgi:hypothetical protein
MAVLYRRSSMRVIASSRRVALAVVMGCVLCVATVTSRVTTPQKRGCPLGRANVLDYGADASGKNDSAPAFRAAIAACQSVYAPAGSYTLRSAEPSGRLRPTTAFSAATSSAASSVAVVSERRPDDGDGTRGIHCPSDGKNCLTTNCSCPAGDGPPFDMAAGSAHPGCWACHPFMPPPAGFLDWSSLEVGGDRGSGGLIGDGPGVTVIQVVYSGANTSHLAALCGFRSSAIFRDFRRETQNGVLSPVSRQ